MKSVYRALRPIYGVHNRHTIGKLENNSTLLDDTRPIKPRTARTVENIAAVNESFAEDPEESIRRRSQQLGLSYGTTWAILRKDLGLKAYKIQLVQELKPADLPKRQLKLLKLLARYRPKSSSESFKIGVYGWTN